MGEGDGSGPWRPVQFLGNKLRSLPAIQLAVEGLSEAGATVWDPFSGSSVVSQHLARSGFRMWAMDALESSAMFAASLLGVRRRPEEDSASDLARRTLDAAQLDSASAWDPWLERERDLVSSGEGLALLAFHSSLPQAWRQDAASAHLRRLFHDAEDASREARPARAGLVSAYYAGTYFSLQQALDLELLRNGLGEVARDTPWGTSAMLTALCHAASRAVYSPGKHFAQPHRARSGKPLEFHSRRALEDRRINIRDEFLLAASQIDRHAGHASEGHSAERRLVETVSSDELRDRGVAVVYADPPYTAQQYSRFYHLLETLMRGVPPVLQHVNGAVTRGLYPEGRYKSPFSSRRGAPPAMHSLISVAHHAGASIAISYSASAGVATGNLRMVTLDQIVGWLQDAYGQSNVEVRRLEHRYRQFNNSNSEVSGREDPEYLITGGQYAS